ncbi:hypothetical protein EBR96_08560, partial [bacterium]|nr:hypothetical protein [bacterium]
SMGLMAEAANGMNAILNESEEPFRDSLNWNGDSISVTTTVEVLIMTASAISTFPLIVIYIRKLRYWVAHLVNSGFTELGHRMFTKEVGLHHTITNVGSLTTAKVMALYDLNVMSPDILGGVILGTGAVFVTTALIMRIIHRGTSHLIQLVRDELVENNGIWDGTALPDYARFSKIAGDYALKWLVAILVLCAAFPIGVGMCWGVAGVAGFLIGVISVGFLFSTLLLVSGGLWVSARRYFDFIIGKQDTPASINLIVGEGIGLLFKEAVAPILASALKLMVLVAVTTAGLALISGFFFALTSEHFWFQIGAALGVGM